MLTKNTTLNILINAIRFGLKQCKNNILVPYSLLNTQFLDLLIKYRYILGYTIITKKNNVYLKIFLKYHVTNTINNIWSLESAIKYIQFYPNIKTSRGSFSCLQIQKLTQIHGPSLFIFSTECGLFTHTELLELNKGGVLVARIF